jgi:CRP-like cAMP-binding protein
MPVGRAAGGMRSDGAANTWSRMKTRTPSALHPAGTERGFCQQVLRDNPFLRQVSDETVQTLAQSAVVRRLANGERWISRHDRAKGLAVIVQGGLRSTTILPDGKEYMFSIMREGDIWGIVSTVDGGPNVNDVYAYEPTVLLTVGRSIVLSLLQTKADFSRCLLDILCHRLRMANSVVEDAALQPLEVRIARLLLSMAKSPGTEDGGAESATGSIRVTQETLRKLLNCSRPTVNHQLRHLQRCGLIRLEYGKIAILDRAGLVEVSGGGRYAYF